MLNIQALRERRNERVAAMHKMLDEKKEKWTGADADAFNAIDNEVADIDAQVKAHEQYLKRKAEEQGDQPALDALRDQHTRTPGAHGASAKQNSALRNYLTGGISALTDEQRRDLQSRLTPDIRAAMSTTTTTEGGFTTAPEYATELLETLKDFGGMREVSKQIRTQSGTTMYWATADATAEVGEIVGQNAAVALGETAFGQASLDVFKYSSKKIAIPFELLQDTFLDLESYIQDVLRMRLGRIQNTHFTTGTGTGQPRGVVTASSVGKTGANGQTATVIYDDLIDLEHSIDPLYRNGAVWMMNDASIKVLRKLKDGQNRPIFVPGYEVGVPGGAPDTLLGRRIVINQDVATMAANAKSILFGNFQHYMIRDVMDLTLFRMTDSAFTLNGQVGFVAFMRSGGNLIAPSAAAPIKHYANSAT